MIFVTETWFNENDCKNLYGFDHFNFWIGGGVSIYVNKMINAYEIHDEILKREDIEQVWCGIQTKNEKLLIGCIYRPPNTKTQDTGIIRSI